MGKNKVWTKKHSIDCHSYSTVSKLKLLSEFGPVLWIRIRMDPELLLGSGSGIIVPDLDPAKYERANK